MKDCREEWYDPGLKVAVTLVDVTEAAQALARGHLCGPTSAYYLTKALAAAALLGAEIGEKDETVILQMKCSGPLGGLNVECTAEGTLRGYTERKTLDAFDGLGAPKDAMVLGDRQIQITRSVPGRILSQGIATTLDGYLVGSLQRKACIYLEASVSDEVEILGARGALLGELRLAALVEVPEVAEPLVEGSEHLVVQRPCRFLSVARDERDGAALVDEADDRFGLPGFDLKFI